MTELHPGLELFRGQLRDAVARDLARSRRSRRAVLPTLAAAAAGAAAVAMILAGAPAVPSTDAAIMRHVLAA
jgi:hypothetical protein